MAQFAAKGNLLFGDVVSHHRDAVLFGSIFGKAAPPAAEFQNSHAGVCADFPTDEVQLGFLRFVEGLGIRPIGAGVVQAFIEHRPVEVIAQVVMPLCHLASPGCGLAVEKPGPEDMPDHAQVFFDGLPQIGPQNPIDKSIDRCAVPPAIHVGFAQTQRCIPEHPAVKAFIVHLDVPWLVTVECDLGLFQ